MEISSIEVIHDEIWTKIFKLVDGPDLITIYKMSKIWQNILINNGMLMKKMRLSFWNQQVSGFLEKNHGGGVWDTHGKLLDKIDFQWRLINSDSGEKVYKFLISKSQLP